MITRNILPELQKWKASPYRKPLIIRGARQVGKTTVTNELGKTYQQYIYLNLDRKEDAQIFDNYGEFKQLVESIFFLKNKSIDKHDTLIFIDEIQAMPEAINLLRYFYEDYPWLHVIAAGSLLETILNEKVNIPVGRVEYKVMRPMAFNEYLDAMGEQQALNQYNKIPIDSFAHQKLLSLFRNYTLIGGMPEVVKVYAESRNLTKLRSIYESLLVSYLDDVEKYARNSAMVQVIRHVIKTMGTEANNRVTFEKFSNSNYKSREVGEAMRTLQKAFLLQLIYPSISTTFPLQNDYKKKPRLQILDTGLMNFLAGIQKELVLLENIEAAYKGKVAEHIVGQELQAISHNVMNEIHFWTREKKDADAEIDYIFDYRGEIFPIEVKSGATGTLRSLHNYMDLCPHIYAIRMFGGEISVNTLTTQKGKKFYLLNMPYYLAGQIEKYLEWFMVKYPKKNIH
jgi:predicted AAA+ superfamily ATPase